MGRNKNAKEQPPKKGYIEIPLPGLSHTKKRMEDGLERLGERMMGRVDDLVDRVEDAVSEGVSLFDKGRVGLSPSYAVAGLGFGALFTFVILASAWLHAPWWFLGLFALCLAGCVFLFLMGKYEIRFDGEGFTQNLGKKVLRRYTWEDVTDVSAKKYIFVKGKKLLVDSSMEGFLPFYHRARVACKGTKAPSSLSEKKRKNRKKQQKK